MAERPLNKNAKHLRSLPVSAMLSPMLPLPSRRAARLTQRRRAVLEIVVRTRSHPDARRVFQEAQERFPGISLATVYRALGWLRDVGLVGELHGDGAARFDASMEVHHHLVCTACRRMVDVDVPLDGVRDRAREQSGFASVRSARVELQGLCSECGSPGRSERNALGRVKA